MNSDISLLLNEQYESFNNYKIINHPESRNNYCYIYCSSNGLYKKNDADDFKKKVCDEDRYEWSNVRSSIIPAKEIFIRDIFLSWYVCGINSKINSYDKLIDFLKKETKGYTVRCVGVSSGGFIANIIAMELSSELSYSFSCQYSLKNHFDHIYVNPLLKAYRQKHGDHFFEYYMRLKEANTTIIYVYPDESEQDITQAELVRGFPNILPISIHKQSHGVCLSPYSLPVFLSMDHSQLQKVKNVHDRNMMILKVCGIRKVLFLIIRKIIRKLSTH